MNRPELEGALREALRAHPSASDLNFTAEKPPQIEVDGILRPIRFGPYSGPLSPKETSEIVLALIGERGSQMEALQRTGSCDSAYGLPEGTRFRVNIFMKRTH